MFVAQRKAGFAVVELRVQPSDATVARCAVIAQLTLMRLILLVAGHAGGGSVAILLAFLMAAGARHARVCIA